MGRQFENRVTMRPLEAVGSSLSNWASTMLWAQLCKTIALRKRTTQRL